MAQALINSDSNPISAFDCDVIREAFRKSIVEENVPEDRQRDHAAAFVRAWTGTEVTDQSILDWIVRK